jgi:hypothetical protein
MKNKCLTWNELADLYDKMVGDSSRPARTLPMNYVFDWAVRQVKIIKINEDGTISLIEKNNK